MKTLKDSFVRGYALLVSGANLLRSPLLLILRVYFFWQLFQTGVGKLTHLGQISAYFGQDLGIPFPTLNACLAGGAETFGGLLLVAGLASRLAAIPVMGVMVVAYLTAEKGAVAAFLHGNFDRFMQGTPFPFLAAAILVFAFGPGRISLDALIGWMVRRRAVQASSNPDPGARTVSRANA
ncbi:MAG: DoxX family protein [Verrucomicrobia bacterium]|nr:DoxX family protein [Verrucomicrobiota bacterium]